MQDVSQLIAEASAHDLAPEQLIELAHTPHPPVAAALAANPAFRAHLRRHPRLLADRSPLDLLPLLAACAARSSPRRRRGIR